MCLTTYQKGSIKAPYPIDVYKLLIEIDGKYYSPFLLQEYHKGVNLAVGDCDVERDVSCSKETFNVFGGFLHAYTHCPSYRSEPMALTALKNAHIFKMTIPKGAWYYVSRDGSEMCSDELEWTDMTPVNDHTYDSIKAEARFYEVEDEKKNKTKKIEWVYNGSSTRDNEVARWQILLFIQSEIAKRMVEEDAEKVRAMWKNLHPMSELPEWVKHGLYRLKNAKTAPVKYAAFIGYYDIVIVDKDIYYYDTQWVKVYDILATPRSKCKQGQIADAVIEGNAVTSNRYGYIGEIEKY